MKSLKIMTNIVLMLIATTYISAQCCSKSTCTSHDHGNSSQSKHSQHEGNQQISKSKGYSSMTNNGKQVASILVQDGYHPDTLVVKKGVPLQLNVDLQEKSCTGAIVFKNFGVKKELKPFAVTSIEFVPDSAGVFTFSCSMEMVKGTLIVEKNATKQ